VGAVILTALASFAARQWRARMRIAFYGDFYDYLERELPQSAPIAFLASDRSYLFYGTTLRRRLYFRPLTPGIDPAAWLAELEQRGVRTVIVGPFDGGSSEIDALRKHLIAPAGPLEIVYGTLRPGEVTVLRIGN
jgi:hypothetical protein